MPRRRIVGVIQARMRSTRLPGKILAPLARRPLLSVIAERVRHAELDALWLATSTCPEDDVTAAWGHALGLRVHRGPEDDVLARFAGVAREDDAEWFVRLTSDNPFVDSAVVRVLKDATASAAPHVSVLSEAMPRRMPLGYVPEIARRTAILDAAAAAPAGSYHRAHVLTWPKEMGQGSGVDVPEEWPSRAAWRWTVDTPEDYELARRAFDALGASWATARYEDLVALFDAHPELPALNAAVSQKPVEAA